MNGAPDAMHDPTADDRAVVAELEGLRRAAPATLLPAVLVGTGLADGYVTADTPMGPVHVAFTEVGISAVVPAGDEAAFRATYHDRTGREAVAVAELPRRLRGRVERTMATGRLADLPVDLASLTEFQRSVLLKTAEIGPGEVRPYSWVAREIGKPGALRAVGTALATNPVPVIVPCHRVVRADGTLGNYAFGTDRKRALLEAEGLDTRRYEEEAAAGVRFYGSDTTRIYCHPTCRHARRVTDRHRLLFRSAAEAVAADHRPCLVCRPEPAAA